VPNKTSQATPVSAFLLVLSQVSGAPNSHWGRILSFDSAE
jgi:hypothetical protein